MIQEFLKNIYNKDLEKYIIFYFMRNHLFRVYSFSNLKLIHLKFLVEPFDDVIYFPTTKSIGLTISVNAYEQNLFKKIIKQKKIIEKKDYIFSCGKSNIPEIRANTLDKILNSYIKNSKSLKNFLKRI